MAYRRICGSKVPIMLLKPLELSRNSSRWKWAPDLFIISVIKKLAIRMILTAYIWITITFYYRQIQSGDHWPTGLHNKALFALCVFRAAWNRTTDIPACSLFLSYFGDWARQVSQHVRCIRLPNRTGRFFRVSDTLTPWVFSVKTDYTCPPKKEHTNTAIRASPG